MKKSLQRRVNAGKILDKIETDEREAVVANTHRLLGRKIMSKNKLIVRFMGYKLIKHSFNGDKVWKNDDAANPEIMNWMGNLIHFYYGARESELYFHESWEWLMCVIDKIESMTNNLKPNGKRLMVNIMSEVPGLESDKRLYYHRTAIIFNQHPKFVCEADEKIESVYNCVVKFIEWYNEQKKK